jgi:hypothetical protein
MVSGGDAGRKPGGRLVPLPGGREVRLADVERMILAPAANQRLPAAAPGAPGH